MAIAESSLQQSSGPTHTLDAALEGLASAGYRVDASTWERFLDAGLMHRPKESSQHLVLVDGADLKRFRTILDVDLHLGQPSSIQRLAFYLSASGMSDIPAALVVEYMEAGIAAFFGAANVDLRALPEVPSRLALDGERALAKRLVTTMLEERPGGDRREHAALEFLTEIGCTLFLRASWRNRVSGRGPAPRIVTPFALEPDYTHVSIMSAGRPLKASAAEILLSPAMNLNHAIEGLRHAARYRPSDIVSAAADAATVIQRGCPRLTSGNVSPIVQSLAPLLAAAFARMRASARAHTCERIAKSAWAEPEVMRRALLTYWS
jgi:hypothetical protein